MYHLDYWRKFFCMFLSFQYKKNGISKIYLQNNAPTPFPGTTVVLIWAITWVQDQTYWTRVATEHPGLAWTLTLWPAVHWESMWTWLAFGISDQCATVVNLVGESLYSDQFWMFGMGTSYECWTGRHCRRCCTEPYTTVSKGVRLKWCVTNQLPQ